MESNPGATESNPKQNLIKIQIYLILFLKLFPRISIYQDIGVSFPFVATGLDSMAPGLDLVTLQLGAGGPHLKTGTVPVFKKRKRI